MTFGGADAVRFVLRYIRKQKMKEETKQDKIDLNKIEIEMAKVINSEAESKLQRQIKEREETSLEFDNIISQLSDCNLKETLQICVVLIGKLLGYWRELNRFFKSINSTQKTLIDTGIPSLEQDLSLLAKQNDEDANLMFEAISDRIGSISALTRIIGQFSKLYFKFSKKHIIPAISKVDQNSAIPIDAIDREKLDLIESVKAANNDISSAIERELKDLLHEIEKQHKNKI